MPPREDKPVRLRTIDENSEPSQPSEAVVRVDNAETRSKLKPVRLNLEKPTTPHIRLDLPDSKIAELRTHEPGIEAIIDPEINSPELLEEAWGETQARNPPPWGWFALIGILFAGAAIWSLKEIYVSNEKASQIRIKAKEIRLTEEEETFEATQKLNQIDKALHDYFKTTTVEERAKLVRLPERVIPFMREYYKDKPVFSATVESIKLLQPITLRNGANLWMSGVFLSNGENQVVITETLESGQVLIDWASLVHLQPMNWNDYAQQRSKGKAMDFRVYVERTSFFSHEFVDNKKWVSFLLTAPESEEFLYGYTPINSPTADIITKLIQMNRKHKASMILRLTTPEDLKSPRGVIIDKIISLRWLRFDPPEPNEQIDTPP